MRKSLLVLAGAAALISAGFLTDRADAIGLPGMQSIRAAAEAADLTDRVHCRPGWWHHGYRPHDGCFRGYRRYYSYGGPGYYPYAYGGPGIGVYGPGFGFSIGPRRWGW